MTHILDVNWCVSNTTIPFDPIVTDGILSSSTVWVPKHHVSSPTVCQRISELIVGRRITAAGEQTENINQRRRKTSSKSSPTIHLGHTRHISRVEIFWGAFPKDHIMRRRYGLYPPKGISRPLEIVATGHGGTFFFFFRVAFLRTQLTRPLCFNFLFVSCFQQGQAFPA